MLPVGSVNTLPYEVLAEILDLEDITDRQLHKIEYKCSVEIGAGDQEASCVGGDIHVGGEVPDFELAGAESNLLEDPDAVATMGHGRDVAEELPRSAGEGETFVAHVGDLVLLAIGGLVAADQGRSLLREVGWLRIITNAYTDTKNNPTLNSIPTDIPLELRLSENGMACTKDMAQSARGMSLNNIGVVQLGVGCGSSEWIRGIEAAFIQFEAKVLCHSVVHRASDGAHGRPFSS
ncbi:hypothetical protein DFH08DRAFT_846895 [Mycena albidolilacea]|uniref:Uncharacterized protein n=1 Tax=Mycena albidolilacea TaxID=1033008 RepID=A0AAD7EZF5_9AGAR|nr:hypothetical protein DFH08DRAFT_846895 [Mycena albidolilacea]